MLGIAAVYAVVVGLVDGQGWPSLLIGAILALVVWVALFAGSYATPERGVVTPEGYGVAAIIAVAAGWAVVTLLDMSTGWGVGAVIGGAVVPALGLVRGDRSTR
mgnify:FL=1